MKRVGVIGLGEMGLPMARNLHTKGFQVRGYDIRREAREALREVGAPVAASLEQAVDAADGVIIMVRTPEQAEDVVLGPGGVLDCAPSGAMLIAMSTIGVACVRRLGETARARGFAFLDAPVSGGRARAREGTLTIVVGGTAEDVSCARPVLEAMGSRVVRVGEIGAATAVKMVNQALLTVGLLAAREAAALAEGAGVPAETAWDVLRTCTGTSWVVENWQTTSEWLTEYRSGASPVDILVKDTGLALDLARQENVPAPVLGLVAQMLLALRCGLAD